MPGENHLGFPLIELLVVVLIIGILSAVALPQYEKAVFKSRLAEVMVNTKTIKNCFDMYVPANGLPASGQQVYLKNMGCAAELTGGEWKTDTRYETEYFIYGDMECGNDGCRFYVSDGGLPSNNNFVADNCYALTPTCYTQKKP